MKTTTINNIEMIEIESKDIKEGKYEIYEERGTGNFRMPVDINDTNSSKEPIDKGYSEIRNKKEWGYRYSPHSNVNPNDGSIDDLHNYYPSFLNLGYHSNSYIVDGVVKVISYTFILKLNSVTYGFIFFPKDNLKESFFKIMGIMYERFIKLNILGVSSIKDSKTGKSLVNVQLVSHYALHDMTSFKDFTEISNNSVTMGKSMFSLTGIIKNLWIYNRGTAITCELTVRDTSLLSPNGSSLASLAKSLNIVRPKQDEFACKMSLFNKDSQLLSANSLTDAYICSEWALQGWGGKKLPTTMGSEATNKAFKFLKEDNNWSNEDFKNNFKGTETEQRVNYNGSVSNVEIPIRTAKIPFSLFNEAYFGGRNEAYTVGIHKELTYDLDLKSAYPTALAILDNIDYYRPAKNLSGKLTISEVNPLEFGAGDIKFKFPENVLYPSIPVRDGVYGLMFPLSGTTYASNAEVYTALLMGAEVEVLSDYKVFHSKEGKPLRNLVKSMVDERNYSKEHFGEGSIEELKAKEAINSIYGKLAQGFSGAEGYSASLNKNIKIRKSKISNIALAATTTSMVRALVSYTLHKLSEANYQVFSVTTDGMITNAPLEVIESIDLPILTEAFRESREFLSGSKALWDVKHAQEVLINGKTRLNVGLSPTKGFSGVLAASSFKIPSEIRKGMAKDMKEYFAITYLNRKEEEAVSTFKAYPSIRELMNSDKAYIPEDREVRTNLEFDFKRKIDKNSIKEVEIELKGKVYSHITFNTLPYDTVEELVSDKQTMYKHIKTLKDLDDYQDFSFMKSIQGQDIRIVTNIKTTRAVLVLRLYRAGLLTGFEGMTGKEVINKVNDTFKLSLEVKDWYSAAKSNVTVSPDLLTHELNQLGLEVVQ